MILSWPIVLLLVYLMVQATERMMNAPFSTSTEPGETDALLPAAAPRIEAQPAPGDLESGVTGGDSADDDDEGRSGGGHGAAEEEGDGKKNERSSGEGIGSASGSKSGSSEADSLGTGASAMASAGNDADVEAVEGSPGSPGRKSPVRGNTGDSQEAVKGAGKRIAVLEDIEMHPLGNDTP